MTANTFYLHSSDQHATFVRHWPCENPRAVVHILHGMAEHSKRYGSTAQAFAAAGFAVIAHDHRGHGLSINNQTPQGHFADHHGWQKVVDDAYQVNQWASQQYPSVPVILLGHSMGSFIAQSYACQYPDSIQSLLLSGSNLTPPSLLLGGKLLAAAVARLQGKRSYSKLIDRATFAHYNNQFKPTRTPFDWLSRDTQVVDNYIADPLCGFLCTTQLWRDLSAALEQLNQTSYFKGVPKHLPVYCFSGELDPLSYSAKYHRVPKLAKHLQQAGIQNVSYKLYPGGRHEALNDANKDEVISDCLRWITTTLS